MILSEHTLPKKQASKFIKNWHHIRKDFDRLAVALYGTKNFQLTKDQFNSFLNEGISVTVNLALDKDDKLLIIWNYNEDDKDDKLYLFSYYQPLERELYLIDNYALTHTDYLELSKDFKLEAENTINRKQSTDTRTAISAKEGYQRIKFWQERFTEWLYMSIENKTGVVQKFYIPTSDFKDQFAQENVNEVHLLFGLYFSDVANFAIPDVLTIGNAEKPTRAQTLKEAAKAAENNEKAGEITDLAKPCPPFCKPPKDPTPYYKIEEELETN